MADDKKPDKKFDKKPEENKIDFNFIDFENKSVVIVLISSIILLIVLFQISINICIPYNQILKEENIKNYPGTGIAFVTTLEEINLNTYKEPLISKKIRKNSCGVRIYKNNQQSLVYFYDYTLGYISSNNVYIHSNLSGVIFYTFVFILIPISVLLIIVFLTCLTIKKIKYRTYYKNRIRDDVKNQTALRVEKFQDQMDEYITITDAIDLKSTMELKHLILETDALLDKIFLEIGIKGDTIGEKLKNMNEKMFDIKTIRDARSAHAIRNILAHSHGETMPREQLYRAVFAYKNVFHKLKILLNKTGKNR